MPLTFSMGPQRFRIATLPASVINVVLFRFYLMLRRYLTNHVDPALNLTFRLVYLNFETTYKFAEQKKIDLVYTNPSIFACLENEFGASPLASLRNLLRVGNTTLEVQEFFGTFIVRSKSSIYNISGSVPQSSLFVTLADSLRRTRTNVSRGSVSE